MCNNENIFVSYWCPRFDCKINVSLFDLHGPSYESFILLYYTSLPLWTYSDPTKASTLFKAPFYSRHYARCLTMSCGETYLVFWSVYMTYSSFFIWCTVKCLSIGTPKNNKFSFVLNVKLTIFRCPKIWDHYSLIIICSNIGTSKNH